MLHRKLHPLLLPLLLLPTHQRMHLALLYAIRSMFHQMQIMPPQVPLRVLLRIMCEKLSSKLLRTVYQMQSVLCSFLWLHLALLHQVQELHSGLPMYQMRSFHRHPVQEMLPGMPLCQMYRRLMRQVQGLLLGMPMLQVVLLLALQLPQEMYKALLRVLRHPWMYLHISKHNVWMWVRMSKVLQLDVLHRHDSRGERVLENAIRQRLYA